MMTSAVTVHIAIFISMNLTTDDVTFTEPKMSTKSKRAASCLLLLAGQRDPGSILYSLDQHLIRYILHIRWLPIRIEAGNYIEIRDPDTALLDSVADEPAEIWADGTRYWYKDDRRHRDGDEPAEIRENGTRYWYKDGELHRDGDEPAEIWADGTLRWYKNGELHRDGDEPAEIWADGSRSWYKNGHQHRDGDEPAFIHADGSRFWFKNGKLHRDGDKPAIMWANGSCLWYKHGQEYTMKRT